MLKFVQITKFEVEEIIFDFVCVVDLCVYGVLYVGIFYNLWCFVGQVLLLGQLGGFCFCSAAKLRHCQQSTQSHESLKVGSQMLLLLF